jgi:DNA (cytosine-5)-methyltransferase 1
MIDKGNYIQWYKKGLQEHDTRAWKEEKVSETLCTRGGTKVFMNNLRIRKLTPKECFRLMGVKDEDIDKIMKNQSNASAYHLAGDSICTSCLMAIFGNMLGIDWKEKVKELYK